MRTEESESKPRDTGLQSATPVRMQFLIPTEKRLRPSRVHGEAGARTACGQEHIQHPGLRLLMPFLHQKKNQGCLMKRSGAGESQQRLERPAGPEGKPPENNGVSREDTAQPESAHSEATKDGGKRGSGLLKRRDGAGPQQQTKAGPQAGRGCPGSGRSQNSQA